MSDVVIRTRDLVKVYRLYARPSHRMVDLLGLPGRSRLPHSEHVAVDGVNLEIRRGEKVALIGRNGAGKSTLLKLITGVVAPTSGEVEVRSRASALLQIGTTFHPEFNGRENVLGYLAHLGIVGDEAERKLLQVVEFAELEEYIDQPVKTYSTGMMARLTFAAATCVQPELLVVDEILSVGDAYFSHKSFERIREMCGAQGSTLLLVSHDIYSASRLCERMLWIERGRVLIDGPSPQVMRAYEDSIRVQEEARLRKSRLLRLEAAQREGLGAGYVIVELRTRNNEPVAAPVHVGRIALELAGGRVLEAALGDDASPEGPHLDLAVGVWGPPGEAGGRAARPIRGFGSPFNKVAAIFPGLPDAGTLDGAAVFVDALAEAPAELVVHAYGRGFEERVGTLVAEPGGWRTHRFALVRGKGPRGEAADAVNVSGVHGTGVVRVLDVRLTDASGQERATFVHGACMVVQIRYEVRDRDYRGRPQVLLAFQRDGIVDVGRVIARDLVIDARDGSFGVLQARIDPLRLGAGRYALSLMIAAAGYYDGEQTAFFSVNPQVYACISRAVEFVVDGAGVAAGTGVVLDAAWSREIDAAPATPQPAALAPSPDR
jgi:lipopolysaccharide transport system ATP-binding protein